MFNSNASAVSGDVNYIEDVFSTYLYTGNNTGQTITNGIDLSTEGGMVWIKARNVTSTHEIADSARGKGSSYYYTIHSESTAAQTENDTFSSFNTNGFTLSTSGNVNSSSYNYASWTFRKQPKFFDVVTYTGNNSSSHTVAHSLTSQPGFILIKRTNGTQQWLAIASDGAGNYKLLILNGTGAALATQTQSTIASTTDLNIGWLSTNWQDVNSTGDTFVAYVFASNAGGFGLTGTDNVISCGATTVASANAVVTLGYEPQFVLYKQSDGIGSWTMVDSMRGLTANQVANNSQVLYANGSNAEETNNGPALTSTGFILPSAGHGNGTYIYIAIRRGPMKVPTDGTTVFTPATRTGTGATANITSAGFPVDLVISQDRGANGADNIAEDRLRGAPNRVRPDASSAESAAANAITSFASMTGIAVGADSSTQSINYSGWNYANWFFRRAPSVFDVVCYTGNGTAGQTYAHNLGVVPELIITKGRSNATNWNTYSQATGNTTFLALNTTDAATTNTTVWNSTTPTSSVFSLGTYAGVNGSGYTFVAYLFATCAGVSKVGSYTGTGTTKQIDCGFAAGARFVMIKRTDSTGSWYVWDSARGIVAGNDPYLLINTSDPEVTSTDYVDTYAAGFELTSTAPAAINASGGSYIFLAIA